VRRLAEQKAQNWMMISSSWKRFELRYLVGCDRLEMPRMLHDVAALADLDQCNIDFFFLKNQVI